MVPSDRDYGSVLELCNQEGYWYVHGHVPQDEAVEAVLAYWEDYLWQDGFDPPEMAGHAWHRYYKWVELNEDNFIEASDPDCPYLLYRCQKDDPDAFPVTEIWEREEWQRHEERKAVRHWLRHKTLRQWPDAEIVSLYAWHWDRLEDSSVRFRLPRRTGRDVHCWKAKDTHVWLGAEESWRIPICARLDRFYSKG